MQRVQGKVKRMKDVGVQWGQKGSDTLGWRVG